MKNIIKKIYIFLLLMVCLVGCNSCKGNIYPDDSEDIDLSKAIGLDIDFNQIVDPPLLKKVDMYNAGCIEPITNYDRDFSRIKDLNTSALRIDLSIGKQESLKYLVSDDYGFYDYDAATGKFKVDINSLKYDFTGFDEIIKYYKDNDILPYISWDYIPYPLQENGIWNNLDRNVENWQEVWEEVYYQYVKYCKDNNIKIGFHEIYNEPDLEILKCWGVLDESIQGFLTWEDFCNGEDCNPAGGVYPDMYEYAVNGILRADPDATVGGPAFALGELGVEGWVGLLPRIIDKNIPMDFYSFHTYLDGDTWFMSDEQRLNGDKNELEKIVAGLSNNQHFIKTAIHINEYTYLNNDNGALGGPSSPYNYYSGASDTLDAIMESVDRTSIQWIYWAQFMESTSGYDPYGLITKDGQIKAVYNAIKAYQDMPVWRYDAKLSDPNSGIRTIVSSDDDKISILLWNQNDATSSINDKTVTINLNNAKFNSGTRRVYRIDKNHASSLDGTASAELVAQNIKKVSNGNNVWSGVVPAEGVVYITINKDGAEDFTSYEDRIEFANDIKTSYYFEDRYRGLLGSRENYNDFNSGINGSYSHFDRTNWTMYLGMGDCLGNSSGEFAGQAHANGSIICNNLPEKFTVSVKTEGDLKMINKNSTLGFRIDFYDEVSGEYTKSVYFHNGLYRDGRNPISQDSCLTGLTIYPWGTEKTPDTVVACEGNIWEIDLSKYAPDGWSATNGKAILSFDMQNTGANTRAQFELRR